MQASAFQGGIDARLTAIRFAALETILYELSRPDGAPLPPAEAGAPHRPASAERPVPAVLAARGVAKSCQLYRRHQAELPTT